MKNYRKEESGNVLVTVLVSCVILGIGLASYLSIAGGQTASVIRSQTWNAAIPVCEAGVEEALAHINDSVVGTNYAINGWTLVSNQFQMARTIGNDRYVVRINTNTYPVITSIGYCKQTRSTNETTRTVQATTTRWATGMKGVVAKSDISMTSNCQVDSFDSEDPRYSTRGRYDPAKNKDGGFAGSVFGNVSAGIVDGSVATGPTGTSTGNVGDFGWLGSNTGIEPGHSANDMNLAFPEVQAPFDGGALSPSGGTVTLTNFNYWSTMITTAYYPTNAASPVTTNSFGTMQVTNYPAGINVALITTNTTPMRTKTVPAAGTYLNYSLQGAWSYYDLITGYTYPVQTYTYSMTASNNTTTTDYYQYILSGSQYQMSSLSLSGSQKLLVSGSNVTLYVTGDFSMAGNSQVIIEPGASLKIYVAGNTSLAGNGIFNYTLDASHFMYYGLPSNTSISISGNAAFTGCIYAPHADMTLNGGGTTTYDVVGATVTKTATMNGHFHFHYDERLGRSPIQSKYSVAYWREL